MPDCIGKRRCSIADRFQGIHAMSFRRPIRGICVALLALTGVALLSSSTIAQIVTPLVIPNPPKAAPPKPGATGPVVPATFTQAQANRGATSYTQNCATCHGPNLNDGEFGGAPIAGTEFKQKYFGLTADALFGFISSAMPPDRPGQLTAQEYADLTAYILSRNGVQPGTTELPTSLDTLATLTVQ
jgi:mono/diheme cytochrome c family protein